MRRECLTIIGTAHVSEESVNEVKDAIYEQQPDVVAIELDRGRYIKLKKQMMGIEEDETISVTQIIKENKVALFLTTTLLSYFQSKIGADVDVKKVDVNFESAKGIIEVCKDGAGVEFSEEKAKEILLENEIIINVALNDGEGQATAWGCDLTYDYVKINGDYRT